MTPWARIGLVAFASVVFAIYLIHRLRSDGITRGFSTRTTVHGLAGPVWAKNPPHSSLTGRLSKVDHHAHRDEADWPSLFASSGDLFAFVQRAAAPAFRGDGTAALYVARAAEVCELEVVLYGRAPDPRSAFENWLSKQGHMPEPEIAKFQHNFDLCKGFFSGDAFASLPPKKDGYLSFSYWLNAANSDGNPVAEVLHVANELPAVGNGSNHQAAMKAQAALVSAVSTGNSEAIFRTGYFLLDGHGGNKADAYALTIAGCDLGYDCSANNSFIFGDCARLGNCAPGLDFQNKIEQEIGSARYAKAYELAQQLEAAISQGDTTTISKVVYLSR